MEGKKGGMRRLSAEQPGQTWRPGGSFRYASKRFVEKLDNTPLLSVPPLPFLFYVSQQPRKSTKPSVRYQGVAVCLLSFNAALHKTNIVQEDLQELEKNMELFLLFRSLQTDMRK